MMSSSGIPTAKKTSASRLVAPSTLHKPSAIPRARGPTSTIKNPGTFTGLKRPADNVSLSVSKFRRTTPLSLVRNNAVSTTNKSASTRLQFKTPTTNRKFPHLLTTNIENEKTIYHNEKESEKAFTESRATSPILDWNLLNKDTEINSYKCKISLLEKQIDEINLKNSKVRIENQLNETKIKTDLDATQKRITKLENEILNYKEKEVKLKSDYDKLKEDSLEQTGLFEKKQIEYEKNISDLRIQLNESLSKENEVRSLLTSKNLELQHDKDKLVNEISFANDQIEIFRSNFEEYKLKNEQLFSELEEAKKEINILNEQLNDYKEGADLKNILKDEINRFHEIQEENNLLKNQIESIKDARDKNLIQTEKLQSYETEIEELKKIITQKNVDLGELNYCKKRLNDWIHIVGIDSPENVAKSIEELRENIKLFHLENEALKADIKSQTNNELFENTFSKTLEMKLKESERRIEQLTDALKKSKRKCLLYAKENESYKKVINEYESETTCNFEDISKKRIFELEEIIAQYKDIFKEQEQQLNKTKDECIDLISKDNEILELKSEIERIKTLNPHIYTNMSLNTSTLQTSEKNYRIIHLKANPLASKINEYITEHNSLKEDNTRLKTLVDILESGDVADMTRQINEGIQYRSEMEKLKKALRDKDFHYNNLKDRFKKISKSFRQTCLHLTGYEIANISTNSYTLQHRYDKQSRKLHFEVNDKEIMLLQDESLPSLQHLIDTYLSCGDSYPAFLAAFTLELYENNNSLKSSSFKSFN